jgi:hypothetical protein
MSKAAKIQLGYARLLFFVKIASPDHAMAFVQVEKQLASKHNTEGAGLHLLCKLWTWLTKAGLVPAFSDSREAASSISILLLLPVLVV